MNLFCNSVLMHSNNNLICGKLVKEKIGCLFILAFLLVPLQSCENSEKSNLYRPLIYLNHIWLNVDSTTYSSIKKSDFLKDKFAYIETKTTQADSNVSWTGTNIWGQNTYIEFFDSGKAGFG